MSTKTKQQIRTEAKLLRQAMPDLKCEMHGAFLRAHIVSWLEKNATKEATLFIFAALKGEPDLLPLVHDLHGHFHFALPRIVNKTAMEFHSYQKSDHLISGPLGIREPAPSAPRVVPGPGDIVFVPALALTKSGQRIGHGAGYYDRYLGAHGDGPLLVGVCFAETLYEPWAWVDEAHDQRVRAIATDQEFTDLGSTVKTFDSRKP